MDILNNIVKFILIFFMVFFMVITLKSTYNIDMVEIIMKKSDCKVELGPAPPPPQPKINDDKCSICLEQLESTNLVITKCGHCFHGSCIFKMVKTDKCYCPICRTNLLYKNVASLNELYDSLDGKFSDIDLFHAFIYKVLDEKYIEIIPDYNIDDDSIYRKIKKDIIDFFELEE